MYSRQELEQLISYEREVSILKKCDHPNILKFLDSLRNEEGEGVIVSEYANLGSLQDYFDCKGEWTKSKRQRFSEEQRFQAMRQIMSATRYLHENNIVHRDLKPANILIFENKPGILTFKLCDFGVSKVVDETAAQSGL